MILNLRYHRDLRGTPLFLAITGRYHVKKTKDTSDFQAKQNPMCLDGR